MACYLEDNPDCSLQDAIRIAESLSQRYRMGSFPRELGIPESRRTSQQCSISMKAGELVVIKKEKGAMKNIAPKFASQFIEKQHLR